MKTHIKKLLATIAFASATIAGLAGCGQTSATGDAGPPTGHACMAAPPVALTDKPVIAMLAGIANADLNPQVASQRAEAIARITDAGFARGARLLVDVIGGETGAAKLVVNTQLDTEGANALVRRSAAGCKRTGILHAIDGLHRQTSASPVNVLDGLRRLEGHLTGLTTRRVSVVLLSSMLNATPLLPLDQAATLRRDPHTLVDEVERADLLPDCRGWDVYVIGAGRTRTGGVDDQQSAQLQTFWSAFFARCGGRIVAYDSALTQFPVTATKAHLAAERVSIRHEAPVFRATPPAQRTVTLTLPDTVLFDNGSATPSPTAEAALTLVLTRINQDPIIGNVHVHGFTDTTPNEQPGGNIGLSQRRALAVGDWLLAHGMLADGIEVLGLGPRHPIADNTTAAGRARNRRVEITLTTIETSS